MNLNPLIINIVLMEREQEIQRQRHRSRGYRFEDEQVQGWPKGRKSKTKVSLVPRKQICEIC